MAGEVAAALDRGGAVAGSSELAARALGSLKSHGKRTGRESGQDGELTTVDKGDGEAVERWFDVLGGSDGSGIHFHECTRGRASWEESE